MLSALLFSAALSIFTEQPVFQEPIAFPRSPELSLSVDTAEYLDHRIWYVNAAIGRNLALFTVGEEYRTQLVLQGGTWVSLGYRPPFAFPLLTQDFYFSLGPQLRRGNLSGALKFNHISAHLGDGIDELIYETLTKEEKDQYNQAESLTGADINILAPKAYSRDYLSLQGAWDVPRFGESQHRLYFQVGYVHKMIPKKLGRWYLGGGSELTYPGPFWDYFAAQDVTWNQDVDNIDYSLRTGLQLGEQDSLFQTQLALTVYSGSDRRGQLVGRRLTQFGFGVFIQ